MSPPIELILHKIFYSTLSNYELFSQTDCSNDFYEAIYYTA